MQELKTYSSRFFSSFIAALFPERCLLCLRLGKEPICASCFSLIGELPSGSCTKCGVGTAGECRACLWMSSLDWLNSAADYRGAGGMAVRQLKYARAMELVKPMAEMMSEVYLPKVDFCVPVPIHWSRRAQRGFNQAEELALRLRGVTVRADTLIRRRATPPQARARGNTRRESLKGAFAASDVAGARILLVDDVVTSGGTLEACATELKTKRASWVGALTFARELPRDFVAQS